MRNLSAVLFVGFSLCVAGCSRSTAPSQTATVNLKDGTSFSGTVEKSSSSEITVQAPGGEQRTYPMSQVDNVQYIPMPATTTTSTASVTPAPAASPAPVAPPPPAELPVRTVPAGSTIHVRTSSAINAKVARAGETFPAMITQDVKGDDGAVAIPRGSNATLVVRSAHAQGKVKGQSELAVDLDSVEVGNQRYDLDTSDIVEHGKQGIGKNRRSAKFIAGGALLGTVVGAVAGGGLGAAVGAGAGAGAGAGLQAVTRGHDVRIPAETLLTFRIEAPVHIHPEQ